MPSPPSAPDNGPIDLDHLDRMTVGDAALGREVLAMFSGQAVRLMEELAAAPSHAAELAHTLNGSALAIGAHRVAAAAESLGAALRAEVGIADAVMVLGDTVIEARLRIDGILNRS